MFFNLNQGHVQKNQLIWSQKKQPKSTIIPFYDYNKQQK